MAAAEPLPKKPVSIQSSRWHRYGAKRDDKSIFLAFTEGQWAIHDGDYTRTHNNTEYEI